MMIKRLIRLEIILATVILLIVIVSPVIAQQDKGRATEIARKFVKSVTQVLQEKVYLHTDKSMYLAGETLWFKAYNVDAATHQLSAMSKVLYIELLNDQGVAVKQEAIRLTSGMGDGQLFITGDMHSGMYSLRAYTSWMKNFDHAFIFNKTLSIINPSMPLPYQPITPSDSLSVNFFPEGGNLITGLSCRLSIHATNQDGHGQKISGKILDNLRTEVANFTTSAQGFASIHIIPRKNKRYFCRVESKTGDTLTFSLPKVKLKGAVMTVETKADDNFKIKIELTNVQQDSFFLVTHTRGIFKEIRSLFISDQINLKLSKDTFGEGISHITLMDKEGLTLCERLVFKYPELRAGLKINKKTFMNREKVRVLISLAKQETPAMSNISVAVYRLDSMTPKDNSISSNLLLRSDIKGNIQNPAYYFKNVNNEKKKELDNLLISQKWERFSWGQVLNDQSTTMRYHPEIRAPLLRGKVVNNENSIKKLMISFPGTLPMINALEISDNGAFTFEVPFRFKKREVIFSSPDALLVESNLQLNTPFLKASTPLREKTWVTSNLREMLENRFVDIQIGHAFPEAIHMSGKQPKQLDVLQPFYGKANLSYNLDDYTRFVDMKELFVEYIKLVYIRKEEGERQFYNLLQNRPNLILLDGIPLQNADTALAIDPLKIKTIDIINGKFEMGEVSVPGIISFITYDGRYENLINDGNFIKKIYQGIQTSRRFFHPDYSSDLLSGPTPDFRHTLLWKPYVEVDHTGITEIEFFTADSEGIYLVEINGILENGSPVNATTTFKVNNNESKY